MGDKLIPIQIEVRQMGWVNIYAPFYLAMGCLESTSKIKNNYNKNDNNKNNFKCEPNDCEKCQLRNIHNYIIEELSKVPEEIIFNVNYPSGYDSDEIIINSFCDHSFNNSNIVNVCLCDPSLLCDPSWPFYYNYGNILDWSIFINRLPVFGFVDRNKLINKIDSESFAKNVKYASELFQSNINTRLRQLLEMLSNDNNLILIIYCYKKGSTVYKLFDKGLTFLDFRVNPIIPNQDDLKNKVTIIGSEVNDVFQPLKDVNYVKVDNSVPIMFTVEPCGPYRGGEINNDKLKNLELLYSATPEFFPFTTIIFRKDQLNTVKFIDGVKVKNIKVFLEDILTKTVAVFYQETFYKRIDDSRTAVDIFHKYLFHKKEESYISNPQDKELDLIEWEIYRNQRIYAFDIAQEADKWKKAFTDLTDNIVKRSTEECGDYKGSGHLHTIYDEIKAQNEHTGYPLLDQTLDRLLEVLTDLGQERQKYSIMAACAAIMARNMSHNLGSHVINYLKEHFKKLGDSLVGINFDNRIKEDLLTSYDNGYHVNFLNKQLYTFLEYLNRRMEFIATIATAPPSSPMPLNIFHDVRTPLVQNK